MVQLKDPTHDEIVKELIRFRKGEGAPTVARLAGLFYLVESLGDGSPDMAFTELTRLYEEHGTDPLTNIGAFFYLSGWAVGLGTVNQRRDLYVTRHLAGDISTPLRRSNRGIEQLATLIRDRDEVSRPWAFVSIFQHKNMFQPFLDFNLGFESWQKPSVYVNGDEHHFDFVLHEDPATRNRYAKRIVMPETPLNLDVGFAETMSVVRVEWPMPIWPVWSVLSWTADPRIMTHLRTFRQRAVEVRLQWWRQTPPAQVEGLVSDGAIWAERHDPDLMNLPEGWRVIAPHSSPGVAEGD